MFGRGRPSVIVPVGLAMAWGLAWIGLGRTNGPLVDETVATAAFVAAAVALLAPLITSSRPAAADEHAMTAAAEPVRGTHGLLIADESATSPTRQPRPVRVRRR